MGLVKHEGWKGRKGLLHGWAIKVVEEAGKGDWTVFRSVFVK